MREGNTLVILRLHRLEHSLKDLIAQAKNFDRLGVRLENLREVIDSNSSGGKLVFHMFRAVRMLENYFKKPHGTGSSISLYMFLPG